MKLILVPTDFSKAALNAVHYAAGLALNLNAQILLLHVHDTTSTVIDPNLSDSLYQQDEESAKKALEVLKDQIVKQFGSKIVAGAELKSGFTVEEILTSVSKKNADLIIMGMQGTNYITERYMGSTTTMVMQQVKIPILIIDNKISYRHIKKIVFATDGLSTNYSKVLKPLKEMIELLQAELYVLHIAPALVTTPAYEKTGFGKIGEQLTGIKHSFYFHSSNKVVEDINAFVNEKEVDMVVMVPRKRTIWDGILMESDSKKMAFHSKVPLLAIHE